MFYKKHWLEYGDGEIVFKRFNPDISMAEIWNRITAEKITDNDDIAFTFLKHELAEAKYMSKGVKQRNAHSLANKISNFEAKLEEMGLL